MVYHGEGPPSCNEKDSAALSCIGWAIEKHLDEISSQQKPTFQEILNDVKSIKEELERP